MSKRDPKWIDVHDDFTMNRMGLRRSMPLDLDPDRFKKTTEEKDSLKKAKSEANGISKAVFNLRKKVSYLELISPKKAIINLLNPDKKAIIKTTYCFYVTNSDELSDIITSNIFFKKGDIKSVYYNNKPFNWS